MKYEVTLDGEPLEVEIVERGDRSFVVRDGEEIPVELQAIRNAGSFSLLIGNESTSVVASGANDDLTVILRSEVWHCSVLDEREAAAVVASGSGGGRSGSGAVRSVMPGVVRELRVAEGDRVSAGDPLLILEAMKMQNEIRAETDAVVTRVHVTPGTAVAKGEPLVTLEQM